MRFNIEGTVTLEVQYPPELKMQPLVRSLSIKPVNDNDGLVLAADVLANSLYYLFTKRPEAERYTALNTRQAVENHCLAQQLDTFENWGTGDWIGDMIYRHPRSACAD